MEFRAAHLAPLALVAGFGVGAIVLAVSGQGPDASDVDDIALTQIAEQPAFPEVARAVVDPSQPFSNGSDSESADPPPEALAFVEPSSLLEPTAESTEAANVANDFRAQEIGNDVESGSSASLGQPDRDEAETTFDLTGDGEATTSQSTPFSNDDDQIATSRTEVLNVGEPVATPPSATSATSPRVGVTSPGAVGAVASERSVTTAVSRTNNTTSAISSNGPGSGRTPTTRVPTTRPTTRAPATTTTRAPATTTTAAPTTRAQISGSSTSAVHVAKNGNDNNNGSANSPVASFQRALAIADPGEPIVFAPGTYDALRIIDLDGSAQNPIRIVGSPGVEFRSGSYSREAGILVRNSTNIEITGVTVRHALWGVYIDQSHGISLLNSDIGDIGQEVVRIKGGSSNVLVEGNTIADSGRRTDKGHANGEGVYIGTGTPGNVDKVSGITVRNNYIARLTDEAIDIKYPAENVLVVGNTITNIHTQTSGALVIHLTSRTGEDSNIRIERNTIANVTRSSPYRDGNCIVAGATATIVQNTIRNCQHRGIFVQGPAGTVTVRDNSLENTGLLGAIVDDKKGLSLVSSGNSVS